MPATKLYHRLIFLTGLMEAVSTSLQDPSITISNTNFKAAGPCNSGNSYMMEDFFSPFIRQVHSRLECAVLCSRSEWCTSYSFPKIQSYSASGIGADEKKCLLFYTEDSECFEASGSLSNSSIFFKSENHHSTENQSCKTKRHRVLEKNSSQISHLIESAHTQQMLMVGSEVKVHYNLNNVKFIAKARSFRFESGITKRICIKTDHVVLNPITSKGLLYVSSYCSDGVVNVYNYNSISSLGLPHPNQFVWIVSTRSRSSLGVNENVFISGSESSDLVAAVRGGQILKLLVSSSARTVSADVIFEDKISGMITSQTSFFESRRCQILSIPLTGAFNLVSWYIISGAVDKTQTQASEVKWYSDSCWKEVHTSSTVTSSLTITNLLTAIKSAKKIRVSFDVDGNTIYTSPVYVGIDNSDIAIAHTTNILKQTTILGILLQSAPEWQHFIINSNGDIIEIGVKIGGDTYTSSSKLTVVRWFVEAQNYTKVHQTTQGFPSSTISLAQLIANVTSGCDVRVKIWGSNSGDLHFFTCDLLEVNSNADEVTCHIHGQLAVDFTGTRTSTTPPSSSTGLLGSLIGGLTGSGNSGSSPELLRSGCPQDLIVSTSGTLVSFISCLDTDGLEEPVMTESVNVDWFVSS